MVNQNYSYSIIIPFSGNEEFLKACLESIANTLHMDVEIIIVTNKKHSLSWLQEAKFNVLRTDEQLVYSQAINYGAQCSRSEYLIFCDSDIYPLPGWFENLSGCYHSNKKIGIVSSKLINPYTGRIIDFGIGFTQYNSPHIGHDRPFDFSLMSANRKVQAACSACMMISKELFVNLNGFNEALTHSYCDLDLCLRAKLLEKETWVAHSSYVFHKGDSSDSNSSIYKNDVKGRFWAINSSRISFDMNYYFEESFSHFVKHNNFSFASYLLIDLSTVLDKASHYELFKKDLNLDIVDIYRNPWKSRDSAHIPLYGFLNWDVLKLRFPIIYFVDRYVALEDNALWWRLRNKSQDLVIDRNANIDKITNIITHGNL